MADILNTGGASTLQYVMEIASSRRIASLKKSLIKEEI
jgi:hypothetical protein